MKAIVYTSNTGHTRQYAELLGERLGLPVYPLEAAKGALEKGAEILYLGWVMAGIVQGYKDAAAYFSVRMVCAVGMGATGTQAEKIRAGNRIPASTALFTLQGGYAMDKLRGVQKLMMRLITKATAKKLAEKPDRTPEEDDRLDLLTKGGSRVSMSRLEGPVRWYLEEQHET